MTNKEAIEYGKKWDEALESRGDTPFSEARQFLSLAIKALEFAESQRLCCENCVNRNYKSKEVCTSPYGVCEFFDDKTQKGGAE